MIPVCKVQTSRQEIPLFNSSYDLVKLRNFRNILSKMQVDFHISVCCHLTKLGEWQGRSGVSAGLK